MRAMGFIVKVVPDIPIPLTVVDVTGVAVDEMLYSRD